MCRKSICLLTTSASPRSRENQLSETSAGAVFNAWKSSFARRLMYNLSDRSGHCRVRVKQRRYSESTCCLEAMITYKLNVMDSNIRNIWIWSASLEVHLDFSGCLLCLAIHAIPARHDLLLDLLGFFKRLFRQINLSSCEQGGTEVFEFIKIGDELSPKGENLIEQLFLGVYLIIHDLSGLWIVDLCRFFFFLLQIKEQIVVEQLKITLICKFFQEIQVCEDKNQLAVFFIVFIQKLYVIHFLHIFELFVVLLRQQIADKGRDG